MKLPNPRRYQRLLAAREERAKRNRRRKIRHHLATCERMLDKLAAKRDAAINPETRAIYGRERLRWMNLQARLEVALILAR